MNVDRPFCEKCYHSFEIDGIFSPKVLKCGHTFCAKCLNTLDFNRNELKCFSCSVVNSYSEVPKNYEVIQILNNIIENKLDQPVCSVCFNIHDLNGRNIPLVLYCGHSFCKWCINSMKNVNKDEVSKLNEIYCMTCRELYVYQSEPPVNKTVVKFVYELIEKPALPKHFNNLTTFVLTDDNTTHNTKSQKLSLEIMKKISVFNTYIIKIDSLSEDEFLKHFDEAQKVITHRAKAVLKRLLECHEILTEFHRKRNKKTREDYHELFNKVRYKLKSNDDLKKSIKQLEPEISILSNECEKAFSFPTLYEVEKKLKTANQNVKFKQLLEAALVDTLITNNFRVKIGIIGRIKTGKSSLSNTLRNVYSNNDIKERSPVDHTLFSTQLLLYHLHKYNYIDTTDNLIYFVDFPGCKHEEINSSDASYFKMMEKENCDIFLLVINDVLTGEDKIIKKYFDDRKCTYFIIRTNIDSVFLNQYIELYDEHYDKSIDSTLKEQRFNEIMHVLKTSDNFNDKHIYYLANDKYNTTDFSFDKSSLINDIYESANKAKYNRNQIKSFGLNIINLMRDGLKIDNFHEAFSAGVGPFMDLLVKRFSKESILNQFGINEDLKLFIKGSTPNLQIDNMKTEWFRNTVNELFKNHFLNSSSNDSVNIQRTATGIATNILGHTLSGFMTSKDLEEFIDDSVADMKIFYEEFVNELLRVNNIHTSAK